MRLLITAGGTGGHVYPALSAVDALRRLTHDPDPTAHELVFAGSVDGIERPLVEKSGLPFAAIYEVQGGPLHGVGRLTQLASAFKLMAGTVQAYRILARHKPQAILTTGGWCSFPVAFAAWLRRVPLMVYLPDIEPGLTIRVLRRFARKVAVTTPASAPYFDESQMVVTGYPVRQALLDATRADGLARFNLDPTRRTVLVSGGSLGARSLNIALLDALPQLLARGDVQILHVTGTHDRDRAEPFKGTPGYHAFDYLHDMGLALAAADVVISRAGASVLGEYPLFGLASILVPYPYAWRYQKVNAAYLVERGAARLLRDELLGERLLPELTALLDDPAALDAMRDASRGLYHPGGAANIAHELLAMVGMAIGETQTQTLAEGAGAEWSN